MGRAARRVVQGRPARVDVGAGVQAVHPEDPRVCGVFGLTCRLRVLLFGASIDGSLWYGDLPAPDGARDDRHSRTFSWRARRRPQHLKEPSLLERVLYALMSVVPVADRVARSLIPSSTPASYLSPCLGLSRTGSSSVAGCQERLRARRSGLTHAPCGRLWPLLSAGSPRSVASADEGVRPGLRVRAVSSTRSAVVIWLRRDAAVSAMCPPRGDSSPGCRWLCSGIHWAPVDGLLLHRSAASAPARREPSGSGAFAMRRRIEDFPQKGP